MKNILFRCDSSSILGLGHVKRCLLLAKRLRDKKKNLKILFSTLDLDGNINSEILKNGFSIYSLRDNSIEDLDYFVKGLSIDLLVIDSYEIDENFEESLKIKNPNLKILSFDDMVKPHKADIVLNHGVQAKKSAYKELVPENCKLLCGSKYTLLRDEFFEKYNVKVQKNSVAIILGGNDIFNLSSKIADLLFEISENYKITVITTGVNPNLKELKQNQKIKLLVDISNIAEVLSSNELIITASGGTLFEVMALKKEFINIEVALNQQVVTKYLEKKGVKTTLKLEEITLKNLKKKIDYVNKDSVHKKLNLEFFRDKLIKKILKNI